MKHIAIILFLLACAWFIAQLMGNDIERKLGYELNQAEKQEIMDSYQPVIDTDGGRCIVELHGIYFCVRCGLENRDYWELEEGHSCYDVACPECGREPCKCEVEPVLMTWDKDGGLDITATNEVEIGESVTWGLGEDKAEFIKVAEGLYKCEADPKEAARIMLLNTLGGYGYREPNNLRIQWQ